MLVTVLRIAMVALPQVSVAVGTSKVQPLPHSTVLLVTQVRVGGVRSCTVTVWLHSAVLPQASVARQVRVASKVLPQWPVKLVTVPTMVTVTLPQASLAVGALNDQAMPQSTVLLGEQLRIGGGWSSTGTVLLHSAGFPPSVLGPPV